jgi:MFS transporter, DHA2 family, methylenomycin A resistance protein
MSTSRPGLTLLATCLGLFIGTLDTTAINLALPAMGHDLGGGIDHMQWVVDAYNITFAALLLTGGTLGDRFGRRTLFRIGVAAFVAGSIICAVAPVFGVMILGRVLQGAASGIMLPQSLAILATSFPGKRERARAMAAWSMVAGIGLAAGPTIGGFLVDQVGWSFIFWVNVPVGVTALLLAIWFVPESRNPHLRGLDPVGQLLAAAFLGLATFLVVEGRTESLPVLLVVIAAVAVTFAGFLRTEHRQPSPMMPLDLMRRGQLPVAAIVAMCMTFGMYGLFMLVSLDFQQERGVSAFTAGLELLPLPFVFAAISPVVGRITARFGPRLPMATGMFAMGAGLLILALVGGDGALPEIEVAFVIIGLGLGLNTGPVVGVAVSAVSAERAGLASGIANLARMLGAALGVAVQGTVLAMAGHNATHGPHFLTGLRAALLVGVAVELTGALVALLKVKNPARQQAPAHPSPART